jgi:hypothetical protein
MVRCTNKVFISEKNKQKTLLVASDKRSHRETQMQPACNRRFLVLFLKYNTFSFPNLFISHCHVLGVDAVWEDVR